MFKNYLKTTLRSLWKNKWFSAINIIGLAIGTLSCLYILLYIEDQYSYDRHHKGAEDIYRVTTTLSLTGDKHTNATASPPIVPAMKNDFPEVKQFSRVITLGKMGAKQHLLRYQDKSFYETEAALVDSTFFDVFTYHFVSGSPAKALAEPYTMVLMKNIAEKLFGNDEAVGKVITMDDEYGKHDYKVMGVVDEQLGKSYIHYNMFITMNSGGLGEYVLKNTRWAGNNFAGSFVKLNPHSDAVALEKKLPAFLNKYGAEQLKEIGMQKELHLQPLSSIHTTVGYEIETGETVSPTFLYILMLIAIIIQVIACINFMNLSTARASKRAKEVGVRKVIGAGRFDLVKQFLGESFLLALIGVLIALPLLMIALPYLNQITNADIHLSFLRNYRLWLMLGGLVLVTGLIAGSYPAFYLSAFQIVKVIKGNFSSGSSAAGIRRSLVVFQFVLSVVLIAGVIIIYSQLSYINSKDIGFDKDQKLVFNFYTGDAQKQIPSFTSELRKLSEVKNLSLANNYLSQFVGQDHGVYLSGGNMANATDVQNMTTDEFFVKTNGIKLISGRDFRLYDSGKVLVNETLVKRLGLTPEKAIGTRMYTKYEPNPETYVEIAGVMKDFNFNSLKTDVKPFMLVYDPNNGGLTHLTVSVNTSNYKALIGKVESLWHTKLPQVPFEYKFLDEEVQRQYTTEITLSKIINSFTLMAIFISCLGLFGLAAFSAEQRTREIGIRKVLGASTMNLTQLLSKEFLKLVLIAIIIAIPIAWWLMNKWLQTFAYQTPISWWMFAIAGVLAIFIALVTVSFHAIRAASSNPVKNLRTE